MLESLSRIGSLIGCTAKIGRRHAESRRVRADGADPRRGLPSCQRYCKVRLRAIIIAIVHDT